MNKFRIFRANIPNAEGRVYPLQSLKKMIANAERGTLFLKTKAFSPALEDVIGEVTELDLEGDEVVATVKFLDVPKAKPFLSIEGKLHEQLSIAAEWITKPETTVERPDGTTEYNDILLQGVFVCPTKEKL